MARPISLPSERVRLSSGLPDICVRHGLSGGAIRRQRITLVSKTPVWVFPIYVVAIVVGLFIAFVLRVSVVSPSWPACDSCRKYRMRALAAMAGCLVCWIPLAWFAASVADSTMLALLTLLLMPVAGLCFAIAGSWSVILKADVSRDGAEVTFDRPHRTFAKALTTPARDPTPPSDPIPVASPIAATQDYSFFGS